MRLVRKSILLAGVSALAILAVRPAAQAADLAPEPIYKAPPTFQDRWSFWVEGGTQAVTGGDPSIPALTPGFTPRKKTWGLGFAGAVDYRIDSVWHVSAAYRAGVNKSRTTSSSQQATVTSPYVFNGNNTATRKESNWAADFMVGREFGLGSGVAQVKAGVRVAHIKGTTDGGGDLLAPSAYIVRETYNQTNKFTGVGPRVAIEGSHPLYGAWSVEYMAGVAALFGKSSIDQTGSSPQLFPGGGALFADNCAIGCPANFSDSSNRTVLNADAMLGLAYAIAPNTKLSVNYRIDYYNGAVRTVNTAGAFSNTDRIYHGPNLRLGVQF